MQGLGAKRQIAHNTRTTAGKTWHISSIKGNDDPSPIARGQDKTWFVWHAKDIARLHDMIINRAAIFIGD